MKVIFLDVDGVLNTHYTKVMTAEESVFVEDKKIAILKEIIDRTGAKVVLSSSWRIGWVHLELGADDWCSKDFIELREKLLEFGIELYDKTVVFDKYMRRRGDEIKKWLDEHEDIEGYVIIDDLGGKWLRPCSSHLLQTNEFKGLEQKHIKVAERILNMEVRK